MLENKKLNIWLPLSLAVVLALGMFLGKKFADVSGSPDKMGSGGSDLDYIMAYIKADYVDTVNIKTAYNQGIEHILQSLDPFSAYIPAEDLRQASEPLEGNFEGIGVEFYLFKDTVLVVNVITGGPSEQVGIQAGDKIVRVNGENITASKITNERVVKLLKGAKGSKVDLGIARKSSKKILEFKVTRGNVPIRSIDASLMVSSNVGYIKINSFSATTATEMQTALKKLSGMGMTKLILDLRNNGGGYLEAAIGVADEFLKNDQLVTYTQGRSQPKRSYNATSYGTFEQKPLAILIDEGSASASEILAGAIQDWDRGTIVGRRSFGKGLVQEQYLMPSGAALRLTVSRYFTPSGRCIQKPYTDNLNMRNGSYLKLHQAELFSLDSIKTNDSLRYLTKAGRVVYGGGGIIPDVFVPADSSRFDEFFIEVFAQGILLEYAYQYATDKQELLKIYKNSQNYSISFNLPEYDYLDFIEYAKKKGITKKSKPSDQKPIKNYLKAYIGKRVFDENALYATLLVDDKTALKALQILNQKN